MLMYGICRVLRCWDRPVVRQETQVEVKYLGDDLPPIIGADERQEVGEELRADCTFGAHERERRTAELDGYDPIVPRFTAARWRWPRVDDGEVLGHRRYTNASSVGQT